MEPRPTCCVCQGFVYPTEFVIDLFTRTGRLFCSHPCYVKRTP